MIRAIIRFAVLKSSLNHLFLLFIFVMAFFAYVHIPKEIFPPILKDKIMLNGAYVGASAEVLDEMAVKDLEDKLKNLSTLESVRSVIKNGAFSITADIRDPQKKVTVLSDVKDVIAQVLPNLPSDMNEPTANIIEQSIPLVQIAIAGDKSLEELIALGEELKSEIASIKDLSRVQIYGKAKEELLITLHEGRLRAWGLNSDAVVQALGGMSSIFPVGKIEARGKHVYLSTSNGTSDVAVLRTMILSVGDKKVRLGEIADVALTLGEASEISHFDGVRNVSLNIAKSKEGNAIELVKTIREILKKYEAKNPDVRYQVYSDTSVWIKNRLNVVVSNILFGLFLVFTAMFLSVDRGIAVVVALGIPVSFMIGLIASDYLGYSLNLISLLGALMALGMLVDEAIVVAENIYRHLEEGKERLEAVIEGAAEMFPAVLTATLTTVFAFLPLLLLGGDTGAFMRLMPIMISILLLSSLFEAFYFLPLHAKEFIRVRPKTARTHDFWDTVKARYRAILVPLLKVKKRALVLIVTSIIAGTVVLAGMSRFQFFPQFDSTQFYVSGKVNINNTVTDTEKLVNEVEQVLLQTLDFKEEVEHVTTVVGMRLDGQSQVQTNSYFFHIFIDLYEKKPENLFDTYINPWLSPAYDDSRAKRERDNRLLVEETIENLQPLQARTNAQGEKIFEEFNVFAQQAGVVAYDIEIALSGVSDAVMTQSIDRIKQTLASIQGVSNLADDATPGTSELKIDLNAYGYELGFNEQLLANALRAWYLKAEYAKMFGREGVQSIKVESNQKDAYEHLALMEVMIPQSQKRVALRDIAQFTLTQNFAKIIKEEGVRMRSVFGSFDKKLTTNAHIQATLAPVFEDLRAQGVKIEVKGEAKASSEVIDDATVIAVIALFLIFMTLVWMFDSAVLSLVVLSTIPLSIFGVYAGHFIMGMNMTVFGLFGIIGLAGVVVNDGLIMVDFIKKAHTIEEVMQLAALRIRPIMLTSITTVLGLSTLIFFASGQSLILQPMAVALGFGVAWATVLNLIYIPIVYSVVKGLKAS